MLLVRLLASAVLLLQAGVNLQRLEAVSERTDELLLPKVISSLLSRYFCHPFQPVLIYRDATNGTHRHGQHDLLDTVLGTLGVRCTLTYATTITDHGAPLRAHSLLFGGDVETLLLILAGFNSARNDYAGRYLLVHTDDGGHNFADVHLQRLLDELWRRHIVHVNVLVPTNGTDLELGGFEGDLLRALAHRLHFRVNVTESPNQVQWGVIGPPGNSTGTMQLVQDELVDLVIACMAVDVTRNIYLKAGAAHYTSRVLFAVPQGRPYTAFEKLFRPFRTDVWVALGLILGGVVSVVTVLTVGRRARELRAFVYGPEVRMPLLSALYLLWGGALVAVPQRNFARTLFALWLWFTFVMRTVYQGSLYLYLQRAASYPPLATLDEIHASTLHYHMVNIAMRFFVDRPEIVPRVHFIPPGLDTLGNMVAGMASHYRDRVVVCPLDMVAYNNRLIKRANPDEIIHVTREPVTLFPLTIYYPKKSCLTEVFDREVRHIAESGLMDFWVRNYGDYDFGASGRSSKNAGGGPRKLTFEHLVGAYELLAGTHLFAIFIFLLELVSLRVRSIRRLLEFCMD